MFETIDLLKRIEETRRMSALNDEGPNLCNSTANDLEHSKLEESAEGLTVMDSSGVERQAERLVFLFLIERKKMSPFSRDFN